MASKKTKVVVGKDDLKRLMREQKTASNSKGKKIDSPLASYNSMGQLSCVVCNCPIKTNLLWPAHVQGRTHKENVEKLKQEKIQRDLALMQPPPPPAGSKRKHPSSVKGSKPTKQHKGSGSSSSQSLPSDFFDSGAHPSKSSTPKGILKNAPPLVTSSLSLATYSSSSSEDDEETERVIAPPPTQPTLSSDPSTSQTGLPADFFDPGVTSGGDAVDSLKAQENAVMSEKLPEGFFDDPKMDAKVRKVEYINKMDEEWALFEKAMKEETHVSEAIMDEEDEVLTAARNIDEIDDQMQRWSHINELEKRKEELMTKELAKTEDGAQEVEEEEPEDEEAEFEEFLDWRSKNAWK